MVYVTLVLILCCCVVLYGTAWCVRIHDKLAPPHMQHPLIPTNHCCLYAQMLWAIARDCLESPPAHDVTSRMLSIFYRLDGSVSCYQFVVFMCCLCVCLVFTLTIWHVSISVCVSMYLFVCVQFYNHANPSYLTVRTQQLIRSQENGLPLSRL